MQHAEYLKKPVTHVCKTLVDRNIDLTADIEPAIIKGDDITELAAILGITYHQEQRWLLTKFKIAALFKVTHEDKLVVKHELEVIKTIRH